MHIVDIELRLLQLADELDVVEVVRWPKDWPNYRNSYDRSKRVQDLEKSLRSELWIVQHVVKLLIRDINVTKAIVNEK